MFGHDKNGKAHFNGGHGGHGPLSMSKGAKPAGESSAPPNRNERQAPHEGHNIPHVTETMPGKTQPHPKTGVHAFHGHHTGGGRYESHTHHNGGDVEIKNHGSADEMHQAAQEALPGDEQQSEGSQYGNDEMANDMSGIGGETASEG